MFGFNIQRHSAIHYLAVRGVITLPKENRHVMRLIALIAILVGACVSGVSQDIIILKDGKRIEAKILEVNDYEIRYNEFDDPNGIIFTIDRAMIKEIRYSFGRREKQENPEENALYYIDDKKDILKFNFTALADATTVLLYERGLQPFSSFEAAVKINGLGFNNDNEKSGFGLSAGYKVKIGSLFHKNQSFRPKHYLQGGYFKPGIGFNTVKAEYGQYEKYSYVNFGFDIGHQWVFRNIFSLDLYFGLHYYGGNFDERGSGDVFFEDDFTDGDLTGIDNFAWAYGIRLGFLFGTEERKRQ